MFSSCMSMLCACVCVHLWKPEVGTEYHPLWLSTFISEMDLTEYGAYCLSSPAVQGASGIWLSLHLAPALQVPRLRSSSIHSLSLPSSPFKSIQRSFSHYESQNWGHRMEENHFRVTGCVYAREKQEGQAEGRLKSTEHPRDVGPWFCHREEEVTQNPWLSILMPVWSHRSEFWWYNERNLRPMAHVVQRSTGSLTCQVCPWLGSGRCVCNETRNRLWVRLRWERSIDPLPCSSAPCIVGFGLAWAIVSVGCTAGDMGESGIRVLHAKDFGRVA